MNHIINIEFQFNQTASSGMNLFSFNFCFQTGFNEKVGYLTLHTEKIPMIQHFDKTTQFHKKYLYNKQ